MQSVVDERRKAYLDEQITHQEYYLWLSNYIGLTNDYIPVDNERVKRSTDEHLNDIPLSIWDGADYKVRLLAYEKKLAWSLCETVCCLKAIARRRMLTEKFLLSRGE